MSRTSRSGPGWIWSATRLGLLEALGLALAPAGDQIMTALTMFLVWAVIEGGIVVFRVIGRDGSGWTSASPREVPRLRGEVVVASLFAGAYGRDWSDEEVARARAALARALGWIEAEARAWGVEVKIDGEGEVFRGASPPGMAVEPVALTRASQEWEEWLMEADEPTRDFAHASRSAATIGRRDFIALAEEVRQRRGDASAVVWIFHPLRQGQPYALATDHSPIAGVALAVCPALDDSQSGPLLGEAAPDSATYAHELLHLFGATDKYGTALSRFDRSMVSSRDVMRDGFGSLSAMRIDALTARELGWDADPLGANRARPGGKKKRRRPGGERVPSRALGESDAQSR